LQGWKNWSKKAEKIELKFVKFAEGRAGKYAEIGGKKPRGKGKDFINEEHRFMRCFSGLSRQVGVLWEMIKLS
jgi:hypothetical protein